MDYNIQTKEGQFMNTRRIELYNQKYLNELKLAIKSIMPKLIEAFTNIYGPEHKDYIEYTLKNINFTYFICESYINFFLGFKGHNVKLQDKKILGYYRRYLNYLNNVFTSTHANIDEFLVKHYLIASDLDNDWFTDENFLRAFRCDTPIFNDLVFMENEFSDYQTIKSVFLPIFTINIYIIAHELNHALGRRHYFLIDDTLEHPKLFKPQEDSDDIISEELMNDYISRLVVKEFIRIGGIIPPALNRFNFHTQYECNDFLVKPFFQHFHKLLLETYISGNYNMVKKIGISNFDSYCEYITSLYYKDNITEEDIAKLAEMINIMTINYHNCELKR